VLRIRLLGQLSVAADGREVVLQPARRERALLVWLALHPGRRRRSEVAATFWPGVLDSSALASLRSALWALRRTLGSHAAEWLLATREHVGLAGPPAVWVDVVEFDRLASEGRLEQALELCRGPLAEDLDEEWIHEMRDDHRRRVGHVLARLAAAAEAASDLPAAVAWTRQEASLDPLAEEPHRQVIRRLAATGDRAAALLEYERLRSRLRDELRIVPSETTRQLAESIRAAAVPEVVTAGPAPGAHETRYATIGDLRAAYQVVGSGPRDIVYPTRSYEPIDLLWDEPIAARGLRRLAALGRLIPCDLPGWGSADVLDTTESPTLQAWMDHIGLVMDAAGSARAVLVAASEMALPAMLFAATHPARVTELVLIAPFARFTRGPDYPWGLRSAIADEYTRRYVAQIGAGPNADWLAPSRAGDPTFRRWFVRSERLGWGPAAAWPIVRIFHGSDLTGVVGSIRAPTLLLHRTHDRHVRKGHVRYLAEHIPHARLVELPGEDNLWYAGDTEALFDQIEAFLTGAQTTTTSTRVLTTVAFLEVLGGREPAAARGEHGAVLRGHIDSYGGRLIDDGPDRTLATFDGPARAIRCATGVREAVAEIGLSMRAGLHTGEVEVAGDRIGGPAVDIGAAVIDLARPDDVLVSAAVPPLLVGSGIHFQDRGTHALGDIPGQWQVLAVERHT
jgi:DNA-binding SARP family transcriptional activator/pimeloyl-ACP methyl ester carboxylesterase